MSRSLNFHFLTSYGEHVDRLGADAEGLLYGQPDLALLRLRQIVEIVVLILEARHAPDEPEAVGERDLASRLAALERGPLPGRVARLLHDTRKRANDAIHVRRSGPRDPRAYEHDARKGLRAVFSALTWLEGELCGVAPAADFVLPRKAADPGSERFDELTQRLDDAEELIDVQYELEAGERLLDEVDRALAQADTARSLAGIELGRLRLRVASTRRAADNHRGVPQRADEHATLAGLEAGLGGSDDPGDLEELAEFRNRVAVAHLNALDFEGALSVLAPVYTWRREQLTARMATFGVASIRCATLSRILGTRGQALAFRGHAYLDRGSLVEALTCFDEARDGFTEPEDRERQEVYAAHAIATLLEHHPAELGAADRGRLERFVAGTATAAGELQRNPLLRGVPRGSAFRVVAALKACDRLGARLPWLAPLTRALVDANAAASELGHPYEQLVGYLILAHLDGPPRALRELAAGQQARDDLQGHIARTFALEHHLRLGTLTPAHLSDYRDRLPASLDAWWREYDLQPRLDALVGDAPQGRALGLLPFNYT